MIRPVGDKPAELVGIGTEIGVVATIRRDRQKTLLCKEICGLQYRPVLCIPHPKTIEPRQSPEYRPVEQETASDDIAVIKRRQRFFGFEIEQPDHVVNRPANRDRLPVAIRHSCNRCAELQIEQIVDCEHP